MPVGGQVLNWIPRTAAEASVPLTPSNPYQYGPGNLARYPGIDLSGAVDSTAGINNAIAAAIANGTGYIYHPGGTILHASTITVPNGITIIGYSRELCEFSYNGLGSGWKSVNGPNSSGYAKVHFQGLKLTSTNASNTGAAIEFNAGGFAYYQVLDCWVWGKWLYGLILDGTELCVIARNLIDLSDTAPTAGIWLVNGADRVGAMNPGFTNVNQIQNNQISVAATGSFCIIDDGGNNHTIIGNNFSGSILNCRFAGCNSLTFIGNSVEGHTATGANNVLFSNVTNAGNVVGSCTNTIWQGNTMSADMSAAGTQLAFRSNTFVVSGITKANPAVVTISTVSVTNPFALLASAAASPVTVNGVAGMTQINGLSGICTATGGVSGAWTVTLTGIDSSGFSVYTSGGNLSNYHSAAVIQGNDFAAPAGRGFAIDVTFLANSLVGPNCDRTVSSGSTHYSGVHNDLLGNTLLAPQNGFIGTSGLSGNEYYGDSRFPKSFANGIIVNGTGSTAGIILNQVGTANPQGILVDTSSATAGSFIKFTYNTQGNTVGYCGDAKGITNGTVGDLMLYTFQQIHLTINGTDAVTVSANRNVTVGAPASGAAVTIAAGTATVNPMTLTSGTSLTTAVAGGVEYDGTCKYFSPAASSRAIDLAEYLMVLSATYTLANQTAAQKLLNASTNGAVTLPVGTYEFDCYFELTAMSASSGSFGFAFGGAATFTQAWWAAANKSALTTAVASQDTYNTAANTTLATANTTTTGYAWITGILRVTVAGTVIPQVSLGVAAAAVVGDKSFFRCRPVGNATVTTVGNWS